MKRIFWILVLVMIFSSSLINGLNNYKIRSLFVYKFAQNIDWPEFEGDFIIGVYGNDEVYQNFLSLNSKTLKSKNVQVKMMKSGDYSNYHLIFVANEKSSSLKDINIKTQGQPILIVSETNNVNNSGINLVVINSKIAFELNLPNCNSRNLRVSTDLITLSKK